MATIKSICPNSIHLENGTVREYGETARVIKNYLNNQKDILRTISEPKNHGLNLHDVKVISTDDGLFQDFSSKFELKILFEITKEQLCPCISYHIVNSNGISVLHEIFNDVTRLILENGEYEIYFTIPKLKLLPDRYSISVFVADNETRLRLDTALEVCHFEVIGMEKSYFYGQPGSAIYRETNTSCELIKK